MKIITLHSVGGSMGEAVNVRYSRALNMSDDDMNSIVSAISDKLDEDLWYVTWFEVDRKGQVHGLVPTGELIQDFVDATED